MNGIDQTFVLLAQLLLSVFTKSFIRSAFCQVSEYCLQRRRQSQTTRADHLPNQEIDGRQLGSRLLFLFEHTVFSLWAYYVIILQPTSDHSWWHYPPMIWIYPPPPLSLSFHWFYVGKAGSHIEDLCHRFHIFPSRSGSHDSVEKDRMMDVHHIATALLCFLSYLSGK